MNLILLQTCDEWRSKDSMRNFWIGDSTTLLCEVVRKGIQNGRFVYQSSDLSIDDQLAKFDKMCKEQCLCAIFNYISNHLVYGSVSLQKLNSYF